MSESPSAASAATAAALVAAPVPVDAGAAACVSGATASGATAAAAADPKAPAAAAPPAIKRAKASPAPGKGSPAARASPAPGSGGAASPAASSSSVHNSLWNVWYDFPEQKLANGLMLRGFSIAALRTNFFLPDLGILLDAGLSCPWEPDCILLTHGHSDHCANLPCHMYVSPGRVVRILAPAETAVAVDTYIKSMHAMALDGPGAVVSTPLPPPAAVGGPKSAAGSAAPSPAAAHDGCCSGGAASPADATGIAGGATPLAFACRDSPSAGTGGAAASPMAGGTPAASATDATPVALTLPYTMMPVVPGQSVRATWNKTRHIEIEVFDMDHTIPCRGYGIIEKRRKLKPEYAGRPGPELGALRKSGVTIDEDAATKLLAFLGDTSIAAFAMNPTVFDYITIMVECTFIAEEDKGQAAATKHIHWHDLEPIVRSHPDTQFVLYHFSRRYKRSWVRDFFADLAIPNVIAWCN